ncbi:cell division protein SepF [archaeon]|nr:cell division protein SepF [archaeon]
MKRFFEKLKGGTASYDEDFPTEFEEDYVELTTETDVPKAKIVVRPFIVEDFSDIKPALDALREGYTIALVNVGPLRERDMVELKRAVNKLKKTCDAIDGDIAGFGTDWVVVTPSFASVHRNKSIQDFSDESSLN